MIQALPAPAIVRCYFDESFEPHLPAMCLRWGPLAGASGLCPLAGASGLCSADAAGTWELPEGVRFSGPPPRHFGIRVQRQAEDSYAVRLLWDRTCLTWLDLTRAQLLGSDLDPLLAALGTDLWYLLDQPLPHPDGTPPRAA